jgi:uncharacterized protein YndB with AHSA1/START domain
VTDEGEAIQREIFIAAPPETVFKFLVDPQLIAQWLGLARKLDPRPGGMFLVEVSSGNIARGEFTEVVPFRRVVFSWGWNSATSDLAALRPGSSTVEIDLEPREDGTLLRLRHKGLPEDLRPIHGDRWLVHLGRLAARFALARGA